MTVYEILFIGIALSMDAVAVSMTNGMEEPGMRPVKAILVAFTYGVFQFAMPLLGYGFGAAFADLVGKIAPILSFALLALIGGKMIFDDLTERRDISPFVRPRRRLGAGKLLAQGVATSLDALAVGVTLLAEETAGGLPVPVLSCAVLIGLTTTALSLLAVELGKRIGNKFSEGMGVFGGAILLCIGIKILCEGIFA